MSTLQDRISQAFEYRKSIAVKGEKVTKVSIARACNIAAPSINAWFDGRTKSLVGMNLINAARYLKVNAEWLGSGKGHMIPALIETQHYPIGTATIREVRENANNTSSWHFNEIHSNIYPLEKTNKHLGLPISWFEHNSATVSSTENLRLTYAFDDSMEPTFSNGDTLIIDIGVNAVSGDGVYLLENDAQVLMRRITKDVPNGYLISNDNPIRRNISAVKDLNDVHILGKVIWAWSGKKV